MATGEAGTSGSNTGYAWRAEQHSVSTDKSLSDFPLQRYTLLMANTLRVNELSFDTVFPRQSLCDTLPELEAFEVNDLLMTTPMQAITLPFGTTVRTLKNTAVSTEWLCLSPGSMSDGLFGLRYTIYPLQVTLQLFQPCSTALSPLWQLAGYEDGGDIVPRLQEAALQLYSCRVQLLHQSHTGYCEISHQNVVQS